MRTVAFWGRLRAARPEAHLASCGKYTWEQDGSLRREDGAAEETEGRRGAVRRLRGVVAARRRHWEKRGGRVK